MRRSDLVYVKVKELSQRTRGGKKEDSIQSKEGVLLTEPSEVSGRWIEYIEELYAKDDKPDSVPLEQEEEVEAGRLGPDILKEESEKAIQQLKNRKSQGVDGVLPTEMIKAMGPESMNAFEKLVRDGSLFMGMTGSDN